MQKNQTVNIGMLPKDIQNYVKKKVILRIVAFLLLEFIAVFFLVSASDLLTNIEPIIKVFVIIVVVLIPFLLSGFPHKLIDKSWKGTIQEVCIATKTDATNQLGYRPKLFRKNVVILRIKKENNKMCEVETGDCPVIGETGGVGYFGTKTSGDINNTLDCYQPGISVYHFYGLKNIIASGDNCPTVNCAICSTSNLRTREDCFCCGHSLIKIEKIEKGKDKK